MLTINIKQHLIMRWIFWSILVFKTIGWHNGQKQTPYVKGGEISAARGNVQGGLSEGRNVRGQMPRGNILHSHDCSYWFVGQLKQLYTFQLACVTYGTWLWRHRCTGARKSPVEVDTTHPDDQRSSSTLTHAHRRWTADCKLRSLLATSA